MAMEWLVMRSAIARLYAAYQRDKAFTKLAASTRFVPGDGCEWYPRALFLGEAPGADEERQGRPFVGAAGRLLEANMSSIGLSRTDCFITNAVKYRPPKNRTPEPEELHAAKYWVWGEVNTVRPDVVVLLGRCALSIFRWYGPDIMACHGQAFMLSVDLPGTIFFPMYHPSAVLRGLQKQTDYRTEFYKLAKLL